MQRPWLASGSPFNALLQSYQKTLLAGGRVNSNLASDPLTAALYTGFKPKQEAYETAYDAYHIQVDVVMGKTQVVRDLMDGLVTTARDWDLSIQTKYAAKGSAEYTELLPNGRAPFYAGKKELRLRAVNQLSLKTTGITVLAAVHTGTGDYYTELRTRMAEQADEMGVLDGKRAALDAARLVVCEGLDIVLGGLKQLFPNDPKRVSEFFPLDIIRNIPQKAFAGTVAAGAIKDIVRRKQKPTSIIKIKNTGLVPLEFYFAAYKGGPVPEGTTPLVVHPNISENVPATALGDITNPYLTVRNSSDLVDGDFELGLM